MTATAKDIAALVASMKETNRNLAEVRAMTAEPDSEVHDGPVNTLADYEGAMAMVIVVGRQFLRNAGWTDDRINAAISTGIAEDGSLLN